MINEDHEETAGAPRLIKEVQMPNEKSKIKGQKSK
jgi:hypothetical protein